ncbi:uncharacterized protein BO95DRAFT_433945 [Aspergillus brunneoviolaceus CBS 621.78]|uniref:Uncharacterized protein n=1 Tax=Aspergillus brunneoviolaceus CBS 621.78 TaxID=1450534 RepID=A0ACD1G2W8_9EURO|nr:hypothetical protein BO95DRAFT_433945 [Aspergillus brunneoviolaceus CBS 621.78]RAH43501.1 hypothetical protein BO95DRAFT_433945 [Aspergillus brunneoviolaceus CBS 621.78]
MLHEPPVQFPLHPWNNASKTPNAPSRPYEGEPRCICCRNWVETALAHLRPVPEADSEGIINRTALVVRMSKNHNDDAVVRPLTLHSIVVQSRALQQMLTEVFAGYQGITTAAMQQQQQQPKLVFRAPFHAFIYRWDAFTAILERQRHDDPVAAGFTQLLYEILDRELGDLRAEMHSLLAQRVIPYSLLWALFEPGDFNSAV